MQLEAKGETEAKHQQCEKKSPGKGAQCYTNTELCTRMEHMKRNEIAETGERERERELDNEELECTYPPHVEKTITKTKEIENQNQNNKAEERQ